MTGRRLKPLRGWWCAVSIEPPVIRSRQSADFAGADNPVRFIDAFADGPGLAAAGFERVRLNLTGRPRYGPAGLLKP